MLNAERGLLAAALLLAACASRQTPNESDADGSGDAADDAGEDADDGGDAGEDDGDRDMGVPVACSSLPRDACDQVASCVTVFGSEVARQDGGVQYCGDLGFPIACADDGCEALDYAIICTPDDPPEMYLVIGECLPEGWTLCPNQMCG